MQAKFRWRREFPELSVVLMVKVWVCWSRRASCELQEANASRPEDELFIVGLFDVHLSSVNHSGDLDSPATTCGLIDLDAGELKTRRSMQNLEAFLWAVQQVNEDKQVLPGVLLSPLLVDTCSSQNHASQQVARLLQRESPTGGGSMNARQVMAVVADSADWRTVEATANMSSALGISTFVTQSQSTRLASSQHEKPQTNNSIVGDETSRLLDDLLSYVGKMTTTPHDLLASDLDESTEDESQKLLVVRMLAGNEMTADAIASFVRQMGWSSVSLVVDEDADMVDLRDELAKSFKTQHTRIALNEQLKLNVGGASNARTCERLLLRLSGEGARGTRVVVSLLENEANRCLLAGQRRLSGSDDDLSSLLWISVGDREPIYSHATDALGAIVVSNSVSLNPKFKSHFDQLDASERPLVGSNANKWWLEYLRSVWRKHEKDLKVKESSCSRAESKGGSCELASLRSLTKREKIANSDAATTTTGRSQQFVSKTAKYLAGGWEHNGMDVINSVFAVANGLELVRQSVCPDVRAGVCERMRELSSTAVTTKDSPTLSELIYDEMLRSTFQLPDGRMFIIDDLDSRGAQVETQLKFYNLRFLDQNSVGFVKFGSFDQEFGLRLNLSKVRYYPSKNFAVSLPIERLESFGCRDERNTSCSSTSREKVTTSGGEVDATGGSLFKLDHPMFSSATTEQKEKESSQVSTARTMRTQQVGGNLALSLGDDDNNNNNKNSKVQEVELLVLLPLHKANEKHSGGCRDNRSADVDERSFQRLAALAHMQDLINLRTSVIPPEMEMTTTIIDYCGRSESARESLAAKLKEKQKNKHQVLVDFESQVSKQVDSLADKENLVHLTIDAPEAARSKQTDKHLRVEQLGVIRSQEISAIVRSIKSLGDWKFVHLIHWGDERDADEFTLRANEAQICVGETIKMPSGELDDEGEEGEGEIEDNESTRRLNRETKRMLAERVGGSSSSGPNATRVLVVLASEDARDNRLLLRTASDWMLDECLWITTHDWLETIELDAESNGDARSLPRFLLSTRVQTHEAHEFRRFLAGLSPSAHSPLPTDWFDQFWQQHFACKLPIGERASDLLVQSQSKVCSPHLTLDAQKFARDAITHQVVATVSLIAQVLRNQLSSQTKQSARTFRDNFVQSFSQLDSESRKRSSFDLHVVHRLLPQLTAKRSRQNSRHLSTVNEQLVRVGIYRDGEVLMLNKHSTTASYHLSPLSSSNARASTDGDDDDPQISLKTFESLKELKSVASGCSTARMCEQCRRQVSNRSNEQSADEQTQPTGEKKAEASPAFSPSTDANPKRRQLERELAGQSKRAEFIAFLWSDCGNRDATWSVVAVILSLVGISVVTACWLSLPNSPRANEQLDNLENLDCARVLADGNSERQSMATRSLFGGRAGEVDDYLLLGGVLMIFAINFAFVLPTTMVVCWFRRIGLAISYTIAFSSLLGRTIDVLRLHGDSTGDSSQTALVRQSRQPTDDPSENIEISFESLPADINLSSVERNHSALVLHRRELETRESSTRANGRREPQTSSTSTFALTLTAQLLISLVWFVCQPPEPYRHLSCWKCSSPRRSPTLFKFETLASLFFPNLILLVSWVLSVVALRSRARRPADTRAKLRESSSGIRDTESLVVTSTLLIIISSILTFNQISSTSHSPSSVQQQLATSNSPFSHHNHNHHLHHSHHYQNAQFHANSPIDSSENDDATLTYFNLISGFTILVFMFFHRLSLFSRGSSKTFGRRFSTSENLSEFGRQINKSRVETESQHRRTDESFAHVDQQELLGLQIFDSYGTYSSASVKHERPTTCELKSVGGEVRKSEGSGRQTRSSGLLFTKRKNNKQSRKNRRTLERYESSASIASSTVSIIGDNNSCGCSEMLFDSASLWTTSSASQLKGNDLYPIDCSIQFDVQTSLTNHNLVVDENPLRIIQTQDSAVEQPNANNSDKRTTTRRKFDRKK